MNSVFCKGQKFLAKILKKQSTKDGLYVGAGLLLTIVSGLLLTILAARTLAVDEFAALSWMLGLLVYLATLGQFGAAQSSTVLSSQVNITKLRRPIVRLLAIVFSISLIVGIVWHSVLRNPLMSLMNDKDGLYYSLSGYLLFWVPAAAILPVIAGIFRGIRRYDLALFYGDHIRRLAIIAVMALSLIGIVEQLSIERIVIISIVIEALVALSSISIVLLYTGNCKPMERGFSNIEQVGRFTSTFYFAAAITALVPQSTVWLLPITSPPLEVANMVIAIRLSFFFSLPFFIAARVAGPRIARAARNDNLRALEVRMRELSSVSFYIGIALISIFYFFGQSFIKLLFGEQYIDAWYPTMLLATAKIVNTSFGFCMFVLMSCGHAKKVSNTFLLALPIYAIGLALLSPGFGASGAGYSTILFFIVINVICWNAVKELCGINTAIYPNFRHFFKKTTP